MVDYFTVILRTYPGITKDNFQLNDDGDGVIYLGKWDFDAPQPNLENLKEQAILQAKVNQTNPPIFAQLTALDAKTIRALREGNQERIDALEAEAASLRQQLIKS